MSSLLIGSEPTIEVPCKAKFVSPGTKAKEVNFIVIYTRLSRSASKESKKVISEHIRRVRFIAKELFLLEQDDVALDEDKVVSIKPDERLTPLTDDEKSEKRHTLEAELERIEGEMTSTIRDNVHSIKNLELSNKKIAEYSPELIDDMLNIEPYYIALREGLNQSNGVYQEQRTKN
jgi:hypothetical protein